MPIKGHKEYKGPPTGALYISEESTPYELVLFFHDAELSALLIEAHEKNEKRKEMWHNFILSVRALSEEYEREYRT